LLTRELSRGEWGTLNAAYREDDLEKTPVLVKELQTAPSANWLEAVSALKGIACTTLRLPATIESDEEGYYLILDYLPGPNLETARVDTHDGRVPVRKALKWLQDLLQALDHLHERGLLHGDVKPSNLVLNDQGEAVLVDLGSLQACQTGSAELATPEYLIPDEELQSNVQRDLYAAALTFGAMVTGRILDPNLETSLSEQDPLIPVTCDELVLRGLGIEAPYRSSRQMLAVVQRLLGDQKPAQTTSPPTRMVKVPVVRRKAVLWPLLIALFCYPLGIGVAHFLKKAPPGPEISVFQITGIDIAEGSYENRAVWKTTVLDRPVAGFVGPDPAEGNETAQARAHWLAAVVSEAYFQGRTLKFEYRRELEDNCEVWLVGSDRPDKFAFRVTKAESDLFGTKAPALARLWTQLIQDTMTLMGAGGSPGNSAGVLALRPWKTRAETMAGGRVLEAAEKVDNLKEAFDSLKPDLKEDILDSYLPEKEDE
jgi:protein kinase-like protein